MLYRRFLVGATRPAGWSGAVATVLLGFLAGNSYQRVEKAFGRAPRSRWPPSCWSPSGAWLSAPPAGPSGPERPAGPPGEPVRARGGRRPGQPGVLDHLGQLVAGQLADPAGPQQHRRVAVEVRGGEERRRLVLHQRLLVRLGVDPEDDHVVVALPGVGVDRVRPGVAEEHERLSAHLVDRLSPVPYLDRHVRQSPPPARARPRPAPAARRTTLAGPGGAARAVGVAPAGELGTGAGEADAE